MKLKFTFTWYFRAGNQYNVYSFPRVFSQSIANIHGITNRWLRYMYSYIGLCVLSHSSCDAKSMFLDSFFHFWQSMLHFVANSPFEGGVGGGRQQKYLSNSITSSWSCCIVRVAYHISCIYSLNKTFFSLSLSLETFENLFDLIMNSPNHIWCLSMMSLCRWHNDKCYCVCCCPLQNAKRGRLLHIRDCVCGVRALHFFKQKKNTLLFSFHCCAAVFRFMYILVAVFEAI